MLKVIVKIKANKDIKKADLKKGDTLTLINDVFDKANGFAYWQLHQDWDVIEMRIEEYKEISKV